jgi:hypothetical protein
MSIHLSVANGAGLAPFKMKIAGRFRLIVET